MVCSSLLLRICHVCLVETLWEGSYVAGLQSVLKIALCPVEMVNSLVRQHSAYISIPNVSLLKRFLTYPQDDQGKPFLSSTAFALDIMRHHEKG